MYSGLVGVAEVGGRALVVTLENLFAAIGLGVLSLKGEVEDEDGEDGDHGAGNAGQHAGDVGGHVLVAEDEGADNAADAAKADEGGAAKGALPLAADVVGLESHGGGDVAVGAGGDEEDAKVADGGGLGPAEDGQADDAEHHVEDDDGAAKVVLVADPGGAEHDDAGKGVRGGDEALGGADLEAHVDDKENGEGVGEGVGDCGGAEEDEGVGPDLPVQAGTQELAQVEWRGLGVATVAPNLVDDPGTLAGAEEAPRNTGGVGKVDEEPVAGDAEGAGQDTLDDEDPAPASNAFAAVELHQTKREDARKGGCDTAKQVKD
jgi:hypothetical protein